MPEVRAFQRHSDPTRAKGSVENAGKTERLCVGVRIRLTFEDTPTQSRETVREFAPSKSAKMGNFGFKEPWKILAFGKCRRKRLSYQCFQSFEFPDTLTALRGRANPFDVPV